jgi:hypothetical protein
MKLRIPAIAALYLVLSSASSPAALIASYTTSQASNANPEPAAFDWHDDVQEPSHFAGHGQVIRPSSASGLPYQGFPTSLDGVNYAGFSVSVLPDHQLELTDLQFGYFNLQNITEFRAGYRIDNGSGFGAWTYSDNLGTGFFNTPTWTFDQPVTTTGTVEIGLFAVGSSPTPAQNAFQILGNVQLNGQVTQVPEASTAMLGAVFLMTGVLRRRR